MMKFAVAILGMLALVQAQSGPHVNDAAPANTAVVENEGQLRGPFIRNLPADQLRDFPNLCFASTLCRVFKEGENWPLSPFCGTATCVRTPEGFLVERVEDCGPLPKPNANCRIVNEDARNETFPHCCPDFECDQGHSLEYPTLRELHEEALRLAQTNQQDSITTNQA